MPATRNRTARRQQILQALAQMLEDNPGERITTASLAKHVGVSEAALYRHFPSKSKMFEGLIEFIEETIFSRIRLIEQDSGNVLDRCEQIIVLVLTFSERNPGISRILNGDALAGETERLRVRVDQLFERLETELKQIFREAEARQLQRLLIQPTPLANLMITYAEGRISQFVRSQFKRKPTDQWNEHWKTIKAGLIVKENSALQTIA